VFKYDGNDGPEGTKVNDLRAGMLLSQLRVLRFGLVQDGDAEIGVFPEREEVFVSGETFDNDC
jgi:hypothetical protein